MFDTVVVLELDMGVDNCQRLEGKCLILQWSWNWTWVYIPPRIRELMLDTAVVLELDMDVAYC